MISPKNTAKTILMEYLFYIPILMLFILVALLAGMALYPIKLLVSMVLKLARGKGWSYEK